MGHRGKVEERERATALRAQSWTLREIATELGVSKGSISVRVRDVDFVPRPRNRGHRPARSTRCASGRKRERAVPSRGRPLARHHDPRELTMFCLGLDAGEGAKTDGRISMANTDPALLRVLLSWLRQDFAIDGTRLRARVYLHDGLDLASAQTFWTTVLEIPLDQFTRPYRAVADSAIRSRKHVRGCATVANVDASLHRRVMARIDAITSPFDLPG